MVSCFGYISVQESSMSKRDVVDHLNVTGGIVVGDDGSERSQSAVRWAAHDARLREMPLHVIRGWSILTAPQPSTAHSGYVPPLEDFEAAVREDMERCWEILTVTVHGIDVRLLPVHGSAAQALIEASRHADLVIVGSRGRGGFAELLLGSVADQVVRFSHCPVTVVRSKF
jgi:nucleotide-binding universal stress UspA family protein